MAVAISHSMTDMVNFLYHLFPNIYLVGSMCSKLYGNINIKKGGYFHRRVGGITVNEWSNDGRDSVSIVTVKMMSSWVEVINKYAREQGRFRSEIIRDAIREYFKHRGIELPPEYNSRLPREGDIIEVEVD